MNVQLSSVFLLAVIALSSAHMCLVEPKQRGSIMGLDKEGADDCILLNGPCGGRMMEEPMTMFKSGGNFTVIIQKNLDHWAKATPGFFGINLMHGSATRTLTTVPDMGEPSLTLYTAMGQIPMGFTGPAVLQVTYVTKNPQAPAVFYQCADILIK
ncbi:uncharacterized protein LOC127871003 [Dreissena polymorpha]|uniref:Uncharacterized protein n=1 Tax=Dreissena polymorpha TaxID=45954 RepID=A0A9D4LBC7_DREPO|nr:uncharacterized protein LOC127871003 [Dreissena polymorpha]KAH3855353.1 hypothetical protein DPMN_097920 [Dreissena polymorpha]